MVYNKIYAQLGEERHITLDPVNYQYDIKQILVIQGETVPDYYEADVCNVGDTATLTMVGTEADGVEIPDKFLLDGRNVLVYIVIPGSGGDVQTRYDITIPVDERAEREDIDPSEAEQQQIDSLINALNSGVGRAEAAATAAAESATDAEGSAGEAEDQVENAEAWAVGQRAGEDVPDTDPTYHNNSKYYAGAAEAAAEEAGRHEASWESWVRRAEDAAGNAEGSATAAGQSKTAAETAAQTAAQKATEAGNSAAAAAGSAESARQTVDGAIGAINTAKEGAVTQIGSAGSNAVASVNQAGTTQTGRVTSEGNTQVNRVQTKGDEVLDSIPQDYSDLVDDVADLTRQISDETTGLDTKAPVILETVSGAIASFDDGADSMPIKKLVAQIEPVQDLHGYDSPWPAGGGANQWNPDSCTPGYIDTSGNPHSQNIGQEFYTDYIPVSANTMYTVGNINYGNGEEQWLSITWYDANKTFLSRPAATNVSTISYESPANAAYARAGSRTYGHGLDGCYFVYGNAASYSPYSNICPISGWTGAEIEQTGKNLLNNVDPLILNAYYSTTTVSTENQNQRIAVIPCTPNTAYTFQWNRVAISGSQAARICTFSTLPTYGTVGNLKAGSVTESTSATFTTGANDIYIGIYFGDIRTTDFSASLTASMLEVGTTASPYEPYTGNQISVTFHETIYGGEDEVIGGTLIDTHQKQVLDGDRAYSSFSERTNTCRVYLNLRNDMKAYSGSEINIMADPLPVYRPDYVYSNDIEGISQNNNSSQDQSGLWISILKSRLSSVSLDGVKEYFRNNPCEFLFIRATPLEYQLSTNELTTLYGTNNIWADTGDVTVTAPRDTKLYIDNKITQAIANALNS